MSFCLVIHFRMCYTTCFRRKTICFHNIMAKEKGAEKIQHLLLVICFLHSKQLLFYALCYALQYIVKYLRSVGLADKVALKL